VEDTLRKEAVQIIKTLIVIEGFSMSVLKTAESTVRVSSIGLVRLPVDRVLIHDRNSLSAEPDVVNQL
jgi:hypothetical protein